MWRYCCYNDRGNLASNQLKRDGDRVGPIDSLSRHSLSGRDRSVAIDIDFGYWRELNPHRSVWESKRSKDPDTQSRRLQTAHRILWTKRLPNGELFALQPGRRMQLNWGKFRLGSDSSSNSYLSNGRMRLIVEQVPEHVEELFHLGSKLGASILFPANMVDGKRTLNMARGLHPKIGDRMDLTLEAIRRHYASETSPLSDVMERYREFFELFIDFRRYVEFWLLNDLLDERNQVRFVLPFDDFRRRGAPHDVSEYLQFKQGMIRYLRARSVRMKEAPELKYQLLQTDSDRFARPPGDI